MPDAKHFREILENSLSPEDIGRFCEDFVKLLHYNKKKHKDKVPCLIGDASSGKTSLFFPILSLVHHGNVATVTKQRAFSKSMITPFTEVIFIDEGHGEDLGYRRLENIDPRWLFGARRQIPVGQIVHKSMPYAYHQQQRLDFGPSDQPVMDRRLNTYEFRSLPNPQKSASSWLKKHPMECLIWASEKAEASRRDERDEEDQSETDEEQSIFEDGILKENEKEELRALSLDEAMAENTIPCSRENERSQDVTEVTDGDLEDSQSGDVVHVLNNQLRQLEPSSQAGEPYSPDGEFQERQSTPLEAETA